MDVLPQPRQATAEQTVSLLGCVLADQQQLTQGHGDFPGGYRRQARQQLFGTFEAKTVKCDFKVFRRFGQAAVGLAVGFAHHTQHQGRTVLHQLSNISQ